MTNKYIRKIAKLFLKDINSKTDFISVEEYLNTLGYKVIFFNTPHGNKEIDRFNLEEHAKHKQGFTYTEPAKIIFIDGNASAEDKKYLLYHEAGHILLGHLDYPRISAKSNCLMEFEADTFAHLIVNPPKTKKTVILMTALMLIAIFVSFYTGRLSVSNDMYNYQTVINQPQHIEENVANLVCITSSGKKYHKETCRYIKNGYIKISVAEAERIFSPCSVCNP